MSESTVNGKTTSFLKKVKALTEQRWFVHSMPIILLIVLCIFFTVQTKGRFMEPGILKMIFQQSLIVATVATGASFIFASGNINLAMGATTVLTATLAGMVYNATNSFPIMIISSIAIGVVIMALSALLSTLLNVRVMYVTIVMMTLLKAIQESILGGSTVSLPFDLIDKLVTNNFSVIIFVLFFIFAIYLFHFTAIGRSLKMIGTNNNCAAQTGIEKSKYILIAFIIAGIGTGIGALLVIVRGGSVGAQTLQSLNTDVMLAIVLGGMSIFGGSKSFAYTGIIGALTVCVLNQGLLMIGVDSTFIQAVRGIIFLILIMTAQQRPKGLPAPEG